MAAKLDTMKLLQEIRGYAELSNRRPPPTGLGALIAQIRPQVLRAALPRPRRFLRIEMHESAESAVEIKRIALSPAPVPRAPAIE